MNRVVLRAWQFGLLLVLLLLWHFASQGSDTVAFFFGKPLEVAQRLWRWFVTDADIYRHLWVTLLETLLAFVIGTLAGLAVGLWLALSPFESAVPLASRSHLSASEMVPPVSVMTVDARKNGPGLTTTPEF